MFGIRHILVLSAVWHYRTKAKMSLRIGGWLTAIAKAIATVHQPAPPWLGLDCSFIALPVSTNDTAVAELQQFVSPCRPIVLQQTFLFINWIQVKIIIFFSSICFYLIPMLSPHTFQTVCTRFAHDLHTVCTRFEPSAVTTWDFCYLFNDSFPFRN